MEINRKKVSFTLISPCQWLDNIACFPGKKIILGIILPSRKIGRGKLNSKEQNQTNRKSKGQSGENESLLGLLTNLLSEIQDGESDLIEPGNNLFDPQSTIDTSEDKSTNASSQAAQHLLNLVEKEKQSRMWTKRGKQRQVNAQLRKIVLRCIRENGKIGWKDISLKIDEYSAKDIKRAIRALRRKGLIERVDGGGMGVRAVFDISPIER